MLQIDFSNAAEEAARNGFFKGFTAPLMLFRPHKASEFVTNIAPVELVKPASHGQGLAGDWARVGLDMQGVFDRCAVGAHPSQPAKMPKRRRRAP